MYTGGLELAVAEFTTDGDRTIDPALLQDLPELDADSRQRDPRHEPAHAARAAQGLSGRDESAATYTLTLTGMNTAYGRVIAAIDP